MWRLSRLPFLLAATAALCFGNIDISVTDPNFGKVGDDVFGDPLSYADQSFNLAGPAGGGVVGTWTLTILTNYGINTFETSKANHGSIAGDTSLPVFCDGGGIVQSGSNPCPGSTPFFMSDFLIQQGNNTFGIVLSTGHIDYSPDYIGPNGDGYVAGNVYEVTSSTSGVLDSQHGNPAAGPVILAEGGTKVDVGSLLVSVNTPPGGGTCYGTTHGSGVNATDCAEYKITETFTVTSASNFFNPNQAYTIDWSSADCFNASLTYQNVPEPAGLVWLVPVLLLLGAYWRRRSLLRVN
ncbi:MAG TPA: hypothetical protein VLY24_26495 [Bryobacteraceae bacterium]|nr:hypothetical protein [Bryobacteraceae bacterium]